MPIAALVPILVSIGVYGLQFIIDKELHKGTSHDNGDPSETAVVYVHGALVDWCTDNEHPGCDEGLVIDQVRSLLVRRSADKSCAPLNPEYQEHCINQLPGANVTTSIPEEGHGLFEGLPEACVWLAMRQDAVCSGYEARPSQCGDECLLYTELKDDDYAKLSSTFHANAKEKNKA